MLRKNDAVLLSPLKNKIKKLVWGWQATKKWQGWLGTWKRPEGYKM